MLTPKIKDMVRFLSEHSARFEFVVANTKVYSTVRNAFVVVDMNTGRATPHYVSECAPDILKRYF